MTRDERRLHDLERLFTHSQISRAQFVQAVAGLGFTASGLTALFGSAPQPAAAQALPAQYFVLIVLDAFRPDYRALAPMPALDVLERSGVSYDRAWVGQLESETPTGHATLSTGAMPKHNGILGFEWRDPQTKKEVLDGWPKGVLAGEMERDLHVQGTDSIPVAVKAADPKAKIVALSSEKVYAADAMGGWAADYILYHERSGQQRNVLTPNAVSGHVPPADFLAQSNLKVELPMKHFTDWDYLSTELALASFEAFRPKVLMINLPSADVYGHPYGGPANPAVMGQVAAGADRNIARIVQAYKSAGIYEKTLFVVTADHGMVPNSHAVPGASTKAAVQQAGGTYLFHTGGTAAYVYLQPSWKRRNAVAQAMAGIPGVVGAYCQVDPHGHYQYIRPPGISIDLALDAAYQYLLSTFSGPRAPDVVAPFRENTIGSDVKSMHGDHGGLNWGAQHVPLIMAGPGIPPGAVSHFPARLMDVAPTVLRLLGVPSTSMDGVVLADALIAPTAAEVGAQSALALPLTAYQDALIAQAAEDITEDQQEGIHPPPALPPRP